MRTQRATATSALSGERHVGDVVVLVDFGRGSADSAALKETFGERKRFIAASGLSARNPATSNALSSGVMGRMRSMSCIKQLMLLPVKWG